MEYEKNVEIWANLKKPVDNDPKRSDVLEYRGKFFRVLSLNAADDHTYSKEWTLVRAVKMTVKGRQAPLFVMAEEAI